MSDLLGIFGINSISVGNWREDIVYMSGRLATIEPALLATISRSHTHLLLTGPPACGKELDFLYFKI